MALTTSSRGTTSDQLQMQAVPNKYRDNDSGSERAKAWTEPTSKLKTNSHGGRRCFPVPVIYYLSRNGQLEHPHFMEVPLSSSQGLFLRDVISRLNFLRGKGMANHYSWSAKRSYKNGYVWHDLEENDFIQPVSGQEYILKGSEIQEESTNSSESPSSSSSGKLTETTAKADVDETEFPMRNRRRNQSWSSINLHEYKVYKSEFSGELAGKAASNASTQTDEKRHRRRQAIKESEIVEEEEPAAKMQDEEPSSELSRAEISPPPVDSSPETLDSLMKANGGRILPSSSSSIQTVDRSSASNRTVGEQPPGGGKMKPSSILASLISCGGSISFRDCGATGGKDHGFSLISHYRSRLPRGANQTADEVESVCSAQSSRFAKIALEDKEYFSGSLVETRKDEIPSLQRSSSYNADRRMQEMEGVRAKCIPRRARAPYPPPSKE